MSSIESAPATIDTQCDPLHSRRRLLEGSPMASADEVSADAWLLERCDNALPIATFSTSTSSVSFFTLSSVRGSSNPRQRILVATDSEKST